MQTLSQKLAEATAFIRQKRSALPEIALILGSGLGDIAEAIEGISIPYADIPGFPVSTAPEHAGCLRIGMLFGKPVIAMQGRVHMYEGYSAAEVAFPVHVMAALSAQKLIVTNASGGLNPAYSAGDIVLIEDHLSLANLSGADPMRGPNDTNLGPRFLSQNGAYSKQLLDLAAKAGAEQGEQLRRGTYGFVVGPSLETPAEVRALRTLGCDLVGMSTVPEVMAARYHGLEVLVLSAVCNMAVDSVDDPHVTSAEEVYNAVAAIRPRLEGVLETIFTKL